MSEPTEPTDPIEVALEPLRRLTKDLKQAAKTLSPDEARFLVDHYYVLQKFRIRADNQIDQLQKSQEPHETLQWFGVNAAMLERGVASALDSYSGSRAVGKWARSVKGVGPIIAAGLLAHIDIAKAPTAGHVWAFAGLDPSKTWEKKTKRPWNADLKRLCFLIGESFVKVSGYDDDTYGHVYIARKAAELRRNNMEPIPGTKPQKYRLIDKQAKSEYAEQAVKALAAKKYRDDTDAKAWYLQGVLPPAHIHARAKRYAVKLFLSAYQEAAFFEANGKLPPFPYAFDHLGHVHYFEPPNMEMIPGWAEASRKRGVPGARTPK